MESSAEYTVTSAVERRGAGAGRRSSRRRHPAALAAASLGGVFMLAFGLWAFFAPVSFAVFVAFPYNRHLMHDVGAFQIGLGVALLLALVWADSLAVALGGFVAAGGFHLVSHYMDRHLGGHDTDVPGLGLLFLIGVFGLVVRGRDLGAAAAGARGVPPTPTLSPFVHQRNVLLTTYRRDGTPKGTPVHIVVDGEVAYFRTWDATWKIKRIRANPTVALAPSTARGVATGPAIRARVRMLSGERTGAARALARKYPVLHGVAIPFLHRLRGYRTVHVAVSPCED